MIMREGQGFEVRAAPVLGVCKRCMCECAALIGPGTAIE